MSFKFSIECDDEQYNNRKAELASIVAERNDLIHHLLPKWDMNSLESSKEIEHSLEQQREKILQELEVLKSYVETIQECAKFLKCEEGEKYFKLIFYSKVN